MSVRLSVLMEIPGKEKYVYKLRKSIYGLKQSAYAWQKTLSERLKQIGCLPQPKNNYQF